MTRRVPSKANLIGDAAVPWAIQRPEKRKMIPVGRQLVFPCVREQSESEYLLLFVKPDQNIADGRSGNRLFFFC